MSAGFVWHELMTSDVAGAEAFYTAVMGWTPEPFQGVPMEYTVVKAGERGVGGIMLLPDDAKASGMPPAWVGYILAKDINADVAALQKAGGTLHRGPWEIATVGHLAAVSDPQGAMFMLIQPEGPEQPPIAPMTPGHVGWNELLTDGWEKAFDFYSGLYGWTKGEGIDMQDMGTYQLVAKDGVDMGAMINRPPQMPVPAWGFYFIVDGLDAAVKRVKDNGGQIIMDPMEVPGGQWVANCTDPQGAYFGMVSDTK